MHAGIIEPAVSLSFLEIYNEKVCILPHEAVVPS